MVALIVMIGGSLWFTYQFNVIEYKVFGTIGVVWASVQYTFTLFEYYKIDDIQIIHVYRLVFKQYGIYSENISRVYIISEGVFKATRIDYGAFSGCY